MTARRSVLIGTISLVVAAVAGCGGSSGGGSSEAEGNNANVSTVKIAAPIALTGPTAPFTAPFATALKQAVAYVNAHGGVKGLGGAKLQLLLKDTQSDNNVAAQLLRQMNTEDPVVSLGPMSSFAAVAAKPVVDSLGLPLLTPTAADEFTDNNAKGNIFRIIGRNASAIAYDMKFLKDQIDKGRIDPKSAVVISYSGTGGPELNQEFVHGLERLGVTSVNKVLYDPEQTKDFSAIIARMKAADPDLVVGTMYPEDQTLFTKALLLQSWRPRLGFFWNLGGAYLNSFRKEFGTKTDGWLVATYGTIAGSSCKVANELGATYEKKTGVPLTGLDTAAASEIAVVVDALNRAKTTDRQAFKDALANTQMNFCDDTYIMAGGAKFNAKQDNAAWEPTIVQHEGSDFAQGAVYPPEVAGSNKAKWPAGGSGK